MEEMLNASLEASQQLFAARLREGSESPDTPDESHPNPESKKGVCFLNPPEPESWLHSTAETSAFHSTVRNSRSL